MTKFDGIDSIDDAFANDNSDPNETKTWQMPAEDPVIENAKLTYENEILKKTNDSLNNQYTILEQVANEIVTERDAARSELVKTYAIPQSKNWFALGTIAGAFALGLYALRTMDPIAVYASMTLAGLGVGIGITKPGTDKKPTPKFIDPHTHARDQSNDVSRDLERSTYAVWNERQKENHDNVRLEKIAMPNIIQDHHAAYPSPMEVYGKKLDHHCSWCHKPDCTDKDHKRGYISLNEEATPARRARRPKQTSEEKKGLREHPDECMCKMCAWMKS